MRPLERSTMNISHSLDFRRILLWMMRMMRRQKLRRPGEGRRGEKSGMRKTFRLLMTNFTQLGRTGQAHKNKRKTPLQNKTCSMGRIYQWTWQSTSLKVYRSTPWKKSYRHNAWPGALPVSAPEKNQAPPPQSATVVMGLELKEMRFFRTKRANVILVKGLALW